MRRSSYSLVCGFMFNVVLCTVVMAQAPPVGFASQTVAGGWNEAVGLTFTEDGEDMFGWERGGKVWVIRNNQRSLVIDISEEVGAWHDLGMLGFALHPHFDENGYFYLLYTVDRHHLMHYGTASYNPAANEYFAATIGRVTRYTATRTATGYLVDPASRKILMGATPSSGPAQLWLTHGVGSLAFGTDHTLLVSAGDGAGSFSDTGSGFSTYFDQALIDGIITPTQNVGTFRSQLLDCYNGKILRIDPETGDGLPSNPFYDPARPSAAISKVYALGLRQPFRLYLVPGTGSHNPDDGFPGVIYEGDVGYDTWEEVNVVDQPGMNFGWPIYEGYDQSSMFGMNVKNMDAPNPLYQVNGCTQQYFFFQNLLKEATASGTTSHPNPCNPAEQVPASIRTFMHSRPVIDWQHDVVQSRTGIFNGETAGVVNIGAAGSPVAGPQFSGSASVGGVMYTGTDFPEQYQNTYFFGDYSGGWIRNLVVDGNNKPLTVRNFVNTGAIVVGFAMRPNHEGLYYVSFPAEIRRLFYTANRPPQAVASAGNSTGASPLTVQFNGSGSTDYEEQALTYQWNFGDGSALNTQPNPIHIFNAAPGVPTKFVVTLRVTDPQGAFDETTLTVSANNTPPQVNIISPASDTRYPLTSETIYTLQADVTDTEHAANQLSYQWQTFLHHDDHQHPEPIDTAPITTTRIDPLGCDGNIYSYRIVLTVTDAAGASTTREVRLDPDCGGVKVSPVLTWANPAPITQGTALGAAQLNAAATYSGVAVPGTYVYTPAAGTVLSAGTHDLSVTFTPTESGVYNVVSKTVSIDVTTGTTYAFYRALNLFGQALTIDGYNWEASATAPNFTYTTTQGVYANQNITLVPATDANRANMIRSSIWGNTVALNVGGVPTGTYRVWVYVWEDNIPEIFSISLEGAVVQANYNSGGAGVWNKLGPFTATIADGTINIGASGGHAMLSGIEIWRAGQGGTNQPPTVTNAIPDQSATVASLFNFTFAANTFTDPDAGTTLAYTATLTNGNALPPWLAFNAATHTFSGTPPAAGTVAVRVTASDGGGGSISDDFNITINNGTTTSAFYRALNLFGAALVIDGNNWEASATAPNFAYTTSQGTYANQNVTLVPATDANRANMIRSSIWGNTVNLNIGGVPEGAYQVWLYVWEDNFPEIFSVLLEGSVVQANYNSGGAGVWKKLGPFQATITDGVINVGASGGHAMLSGVEIWTVGTTSGNQPPVVSNIIPDQSATVGALFNFAFASNTFTDPNAGTTLTYAATLSNGNPLPAWLTFAAATRTFSGTPASADIGSITIRVTASDGSGGSVSDDFVLTTSSGNQPPVVSNAIPDQSATVGAVFNFAFASNTFTDPNAGTTLTYAATLSNGNALPVWLTFTAPTRTFSGTPSSGDEGAITIRVTASDGSGGSVTDDFVLTASSGNQPPVVSNAIPDQSATVGALFNFAFASNTFTDPNAGTTLTYAATLVNGNALPGWLTFTAATRTFSGTPATGDTGSITLRVTASDGSGGSVSDDFLVTVNSSGTASFYRALNLYGPALVIDGHNWEASATAPNFTYTTNQGVYANQTVALVPATDANRASMIRSSIWGNSVNLALGGIPPATYQVWLYVWEDNIPEIFSISLEGIVVRANYNSGGTGIWSKLGPFQATITDGTINVGAVGGHAMLSGLEVWTAGAPPANQPPVVATVIPDQTTAASSAFSFTFAANTFTDPNPGTTLTYAATLSNGNALPAWLTFSASTRTFSGTPAVINMGTFSVSVTASDGLASVSDVFDIVVTAPVNHPPVVSNPIPDQAATTGSPYAYTIPANSFTDIDAGAVLTYSATLTSGDPLPAWLTFTADTRSFSGTPGAGDAGTLAITVTVHDDQNASATDAFNLTVSVPGTGPTFYRALNLFGPALVIDGNNWEASAGAPNFSYTTTQGTYANQTVALVPATDANRASMIRSSIWGNTVNLNIGGVPPGTYEVSVYVWEDNFPEIFSIRLEGAVVQANYNSGGTGIWKRLGPFQATINDGVINIGASGGHAMLSGVEIWTVGTSSGNQPPVVSNIIPDQNATVGALFNFAFATNTFTDPNAGTTLTYGAALSNGNALPAWLTFTAATRTFSGTPASGDVGSITIRVSASDGSGGSVSDDFVLTSSAGNQPPVVSNAIPDQSATVGALFNFAFAANTFTDPNAGTTLAYTAALSNGTALPGWITFTETTRTFSGTPSAGDAGAVTIRVTASDGNGGLVSDDFVVTTSSGNQPPVVANAIPDQNATAGALFSFTFAANAFTDPNAGTTLTYSATLSNGNALPAWLTFTPATRTFNGTPAATDAGVITARVTASDGSGGSVTDDFLITVGTSATATFYRALNLFGPALLIDGNNWEASATASNFTYTTNQGVFANQNVSLVPATDANRANMIRSCIWGNTVMLNIGAVPAGTYQVWVYVWEDNFPEIFSISLEGIVVQANYNSGGTGIWKRLGPFQATVNDGTINVGAVGGHAMLSGIEIWKAPHGGSTARIADPAINKTLLSVDELAAIEKVELAAYPNPFANVVTVKFTPKEDSPSKVAIFDLTGVKVRVLFEGSLPPGTEHTLDVDLGNLADDTYVLQLLNGSLAKHIKLVKAIR